MKTKELTLTAEKFRDYLNECFEYQPDSGEFKWKVRPLSHFKRASDCAGFNKLHAGKNAGSVGNNGYLGVGLLGKRMQAHRLIWIMFYGAPPDCIDHINGDRTDNRIENLRSVSVRENNRNKSSVSWRPQGSTGVYWCSLHKKFRARLKVDGVNIHIGYYSTMEEAREERKKVEVSKGFHHNHGRSMAGGAHEEH